MFTVISLGTICRKFWGADVLGQKLRAGPRNLGKTSIWARTPMTRTRGRSWPHGAKELRAEKLRADFSFPIRERKKHVNINKGGGLSWDWVGGKTCLCVFGVIPYGQANTSAKFCRKSQDIPSKHVFMCFILRCFCRSPPQRKQKGKKPDYSGRISSDGLVVLPVNQVGVDGDTFSIKAPKNVLRSLLPLSKGNSLPEEMFLEHSFCS